MKAEPDGVERPESIDLPAGPGLAGLDHLGLSEQKIDRLLWSLVGLGIFLRLGVYALRLPIWTDEAKLAASLLDRGYAELLEPLAFDMIAPVFFMWLQKTASVVFGFSEYSLRLVPLLSAIAGVLLMHRLTRQVLSGMPAVFSVALFAVSYYPIRHSAELKPYATDLFASLVLTAIAVEWLVKHDPRRLWLLAVVSPISVALSYPAIFTAGGIVMALAIPVWRRRDLCGLLALGTGALLAAAMFALNFFAVAARQYDTRAVANLPWDWGFPPLDDALGALEWVVRAHTGRTFGYPLGGENGGSILTFAAFVIGAVVLFRAGRKRLLAVLLLPFSLGFAAAVLQRYPYGGSGRVSQYMVPAICLLVGLGAARLSSLARRSATRRRAQAGVLAFFLLFGLLIGTAAIVRPYRDQPDAVARDFARWFWDVKSRGAELVCGWEDLQLEFAHPPAGWSPGGAGYRLNQRIYSRRIRRGEPPDLARVSRQHPLRVVFQGRAVDSRRDALQRWLREMETRYELVDRDRHRLGGFREQHGSEDWVELYTFVPRDDGDVSAPASPDL